MPLLPDGLLTNLFGGGPQVSNPFALGGHNVLTQPILPQQQQPYSPPPHLPIAGEIQGAFSRHRNSMPKAPLPNPVPEPPSGIGGTLQPQPQPIQPTRPTGPIGPIAREPMPGPVPGGLNPFGSGPVMRGGKPPMTPVARNMGQGPQEMQGMGQGQGQGGVNPFMGQMRQAGLGALGGGFNQINPFMGSQFRGR